MDRSISPAQIRGKRFLKVFGNTYPHREAIKKLGKAEFSKAEKCWVINLVGLPHTQAAKVAAQTYELGKLGLSFEVEA